MRKFKPHLRATTRSLLYVLAVVAFAGCELPTTGSDSGLAATDGAQGGAGGQGGTGPDVGAGGQGGVGPDAGAGGQGGAGPDAGAGGQGGAGPDAGAGGQGGGGPDAGAGGQGGGGPVGNICEQSIEPGPCRGSFPSWGFDARSGDCVEFIYGGCEGNDNRFESLDACRAVCADEPPQQVCGTRGAERCPRDQYCDYVDGNVCGADDRGGVCRPRIQDCDAAWDPVCGCDGQTYGSACEAAARGLDFASEGACRRRCDAEACDGAPPRPAVCEDGSQLEAVCGPNDDGRCVWRQERCDQGPRICTGDAQCDDGELCQRPAGVCGVDDAPGECQPRPEACPRIWRPVCGCDDLTYGNACEAAAAGVGVAQAGQCDADPPGECGPDDCEGPGPRAPIIECEDGSIGGPMCAPTERGCQWTVRVCPEVQRCASNDDCARDGFCAKDSCREREGVCSPRPDVCERILAPVCGCDGETYGNACVAASEGANVAHEGACAPVDICALPVQPGPCRGSFPRWFRNDRTGVCEAFVYGGCDGNANNFETREACEAECGEPAQICGTRGAEPCPDGQLCDFPDGSMCGAADQGGHCVVQPELCPDVRDPVCGCDGVSYSSACTAAANGVDVIYDGMCQQPECSPRDCGPRPGDLEVLCEDGTVGGPVCGRDAAGRCGWTVRECVGGQRCDDNAACADAEFCLQDGCGAAGNCAPRPEACIRLLDPVCGCDGETYDNSCSAARAGVSVAREGQCAAVDRCDLPMEVGPCDAAIPQWFHNPETNSCEEFVYGGCGGNGNRFATQAECEGACEAVEPVCGTRGARPCAAGQYCDFPDGEPGCGADDRGGVCAAQPRRCLDVFAPVCGCDGVTYPNACVAAQAGVDSSQRGACPELACDAEECGPGLLAPIVRCEDGTIGGPICERDADGVCGWEVRLCPGDRACEGNADCPEGYCEQRECGAGGGVCAEQPVLCNRIYAPVCGCDGITYGNACMAASAGASVQAEGACAAPDVCELPADPGPCEAALPRWFHNSESGACERFIYGGCQGNENNFETLAACERTCVPQVPACEQRIDPGPCRGSFPRFGYDARTGACEPFIYGGCEGNDNNFETLEACEGACVAPEPVCEQRIDPGPCRGSIPRFGYNAGTGVCEAFIYGGCEGNDNNFETLAACEGACVPPPQFCGAPGTGPCPDGQFCQFPEENLCGATDLGGFCATAPAACPDVLRPVCGCDGQTYNNSCEAALVGVSVAAEGRCGGVAQVCGTRGAEPCAAEQFCNFGDANLCGGGDRGGICEDRPLLCEAIGRSVCGCDGQTYINECAANRDGVDVLAAGACADSRCEVDEQCASGFCQREACGDPVGVCAEPPALCARIFAPVCGCDGVTYGNACEANAQSMNVAHDGECVVERACGGRLGDTCGRAEFCDFARNGCGQDDGQGVCRARPDACIDLFDPVCGCDQTTYGNGCQANAAGVDVLYAGRCQLAR